MKRYLFNKEEQRFLIENYKKYTNLELSSMLNNKFTSQQINSWLNGHGYKKRGKNKNNPHVFTEYEINFIKENYLNMTFSEMENILNIKSKVIRSKANHLGLRKIREYNKSYFQNIDTPLKAYFLGFIYADGWVIYEENRRSTEFGMSLIYTDKYILDKLESELGGSNNISIVPPKTKVINGIETHSKKQYVLRIYCKQIVKDLISHNIFQNKTQHKEIPYVDELLFFDFLRGYIDGDGCFCRNDKNIYNMNITCCNEEPLIYIKNKLKNYKINTRTYKEKDNKYRLVCYTQKDIIKLVNHLYYTDGLFCLSRKYNKVKDLIGLSI